MTIATANLNPTQVVRLFYKTVVTYLNEEQEASIMGSEFNQLLYKDQYDQLTEPEKKRKEEIESTLIQPRNKVMKIEVLDVSDKVTDKIKCITTIGRVDWDIITKEIAKIESEGMAQIPYKDHHNIID